MKETLTAIRETIQNSKRIVIATHANPDGDALGSTLALALGLQKLYPEKSLTVVCPSPVPEGFSFLPNLQLFTQEFGSRDLVLTVDTSRIHVDKVSYKENGNRLELYVTPVSGKFQVSELSHHYGKPATDLVIVLDCGELSRLGNIYGDEKDLFESIPVINIDHHQDNTNFGSINFVDTKAAATAQLIYQLLLSMQIPLDATIATALLTGLITDTGNFQHSSTTPEAFLIASKLLEVGAQHQEIIEQIYRMKKYTTLKLWGYILAKIKNTADEKIIWSTVTKEDLQRSNGNLPEAEAVLDELMLATPKAEVILLFYEQVDEIRISIRTTDGVNAAKLAESFGGGGHPRAAGCRLTGFSLQQTEDLVIKRVEEQYRSGSILEPRTALQNSTQPQSYSPEQIIKKIGEMLE